MANTILIKRGLEADIANLELLPGELGVTLDTQKLYVGDADGNVTMVKASSAGAVESANKLTTARNIALSGDATGTTAFDGSSNVEIAVKLANSGVSAGTYTKVTVDAKGRVTTGTSLEKSDLPTIVIEDVNGLTDEFKKYVTLTKHNTDYETLNTKIDKLNDYAGIKYAWVDDNMPEWARPTINKLMQKGILKGSGKNGELDLSYDDLRLLVILDRPGLFD